MPNRDYLHDTVKRALIKDGWIITHDPFAISFGLRRVYADLGVEKLIAAEKESRKIVVEIKSFIGVSQITELERAIGQFAIYKSWLNRTEPERTLYIALDTEAFDNLFQDISGQVLISDYSLKFVIVNEIEEVIEQWIS